MIIVVYVIVALVSYAIFLSLERGTLDDKQAEELAAKCGPLKVRWWEWLGIGIGFPLAVLVSPILLPVCIVGWAVTRYREKDR